MMRKFALLALLAAGLVVPGVAAADTAQGKLTGSGDLLTIATPVIDGGTSYVGLENDKSGDCSGDTGSVALPGEVAETVVCAHFVASSRDGSGPKMRFA